MKRMSWIAAGMALLLGASGAYAQSLGDVARSNRQAKAQQPSSSRQFDNDNLPTENPISVVGKPADSAPSANKKASTGPSTDNGKTETSEAKSASTASKPVAVDWKKKIEEQKKKIEELTRELDLNEREYRLRAVAMYSDVGNRLRNAAQWDKEDADYKQRIAGQQQALDSAKQELADMEERARKE